MNLKTIYLLRHGQTEYNRKGIVQGKGIDAPLNETGKTQAQATCEYFQTISLDKIYTSTLIRTKETVASLLDLGIPHEALAGFDEISWGNQEGNSGNEKTKAIYKQLMLDWKNGKLEKKIEEGESPLEVMQRQKTAMENVFSATNEMVLICMHGRAMRILLCWLTGKNLSEMDIFTHRNCAIYKLNHVKDQHFEIEISDAIVYSE